MYSTTIARPKLQTAVVKHLYDPDYNNEQVTIAGPTTAATYDIGTVLGQVTASGKYVPLAPAATDGSQHAAAVLFRAVKAPAATDVPAAVIVRGPAVVVVDGLVGPAGITDAQKAAALAELLALGIVPRAI